MKVPTLKQATEFIKYAEEKNPGEWIAHSYNVAKAAKSIARECPDLDGEIAYVLGLLHDIGRHEGRVQMHHSVSGYDFLMSKGYDDAARIALTHSFTLPDIRGYAGQVDCTEAELTFIKDYIKSTIYNDYDKLIQLCDAIALPEGICLMEKRLLNVVMRYGINDLTLIKWKTQLGLSDYFSKKIGKSIYKVLDGVVETTFGLNAIITDK
ncbi:HD domain-containing protein [Clostridium sp. FP2]|uniref:HD domain-containing protein n=1 Tax=Clostridium TaxID=1485 RepID=UPI0013E90D15|nr:MULTISPECIES: HD domain-containing protein [Clostridium]MBW9157887.1 HD domain-containing protein [Clostridium tagluense]MBZ9622793.1 HD domain-containing protein [Clostridium sp. FP2]WLC67085.1 HD domain-containing protein [Clostridium tagluense]